jgi:hypothetical protein
MSETGSDGDTGAHTADRNALVANWFTISRAVWNMHDALLNEQRRTNQLLETLIEAQGGTVPVPKAPLAAHFRFDQRPADGLRFDDLGQVIDVPKDSEAAPSNEGGPMFDDTGQVIR